MKTKTISITFLFLAAQLSVGAAFANKGSRKIARDSSMRTDVPVRADMVPVTTYTTPAAPMGIAANSYQPAPQPTTQYVFQPPAMPQQTDTMTPMLMSAVMQLFSGMKGSSSSKPSTATTPSSTSTYSDPTSTMTDAQVDTQTYTNTKPDAVADLNASANNDDAEVAVPGNSPSKSHAGHGHLHSMKKDSETSAGQCLAPVKTVGDAKRVLVRNGVKVGQETNERQLVSLAMGIQQLELLSGGRANYVNGSTFRFLKNNSFSAQRATGIYMGANHNDGNVMHLMHELGHYAGNAGLYAGYKKLGRCNLTNYSHKDYSAATARNEEFAEVFAAFVASPQILKNSSNQNCKDAFQYLASAYPKAKDFAICDRTALIAAVNAKSNTQTASLGATPGEARAAVQ